MIEEIVNFLKRKAGETLEEKTKKEFEEDVAELERWLEKQKDE